MTKRNAPPPKLSRPSRHSASNLTPVSADIRCTNLDRVRETIASLALACLFALGFFWLMGGSLDTITRGQWADPDDHPANYYDSTVYW